MLIPYSRFPRLMLLSAPAASREHLRDLLLVIGISIVTFVLSTAFELREWLTEVTRPLERYQIDELPVTFMVLAIALAWFAWRRWREAEQELRIRVAAQRALTEREGQYHTLFIENRLLSQRYVSLQEEERRSLARELHDELGQYLNAIKVDAVAIRDVARNRQPEIEAIAIAIVEISTHVYDAVRGIMQQLRPAALDALGLHDAVVDLVDQWQRCNPAVDCTFIAKGDLSGLGEVIDITLYRFAQECLTNVAKHAQATRVTVTLERTVAEEVAVSVCDDGHGMDLEVKRTGLGLIGLRERVDALHGRMQVASEPGNGLVVSASVPVSAV